MNTSSTHSVDDPLVPKRRQYSPDQVALRAKLDDLQKDDKPKLTCPACKQVCFFNKEGFIGSKCNFKCRGCKGKISEDNFKALLTKMDGSLCGPRPSASSFRIMPATHMSNSTTSRLNSPSRSDSDPDDFNGWMSPNGNESAEERIYSTEPYPCQNIENGTEKIFNNTRNRMETENDDSSERIQAIEDACDSDVTNESLIPKEIKKVTPGFLGNYKLPKNPSPEGNNVVDRSRQDVVVQAQSKKKLKAKTALNGKSRKKTTAMRFLGFVENTPPPRPEADRPPNTTSILNLSECVPLLFWKVEHAPIRNIRHGFHMMNIDVHGIIRDISWSGSNKLSIIILKEAASDFTDFVKGTLGWSVYDEKNELGKRKESIIFTARKKEETVFKFFNDQRSLSTIEDQEVCAFLKEYSFGVVQKILSWSQQDMERLWSQSSNHLVKVARSKKEYNEKKNNQQIKANNNQILKSPLEEPVSQV
jgi:hypothetical protein